MYDIQNGHHNVNTGEGLCAVIFTQDLTPAGTGTDARFHSLSNL